MSTLHILQNFVTEKENKLTDEERLVNFKKELAKDVAVEFKTKGIIVHADVIEKLTEDFKEHLKLPRQIVSDTLYQGTSVSFLSTPPQIKNYRLYTDAEKEQSWAEGINPGQGHTKALEKAASEIIKALNLDFVVKNISDIRAPNTKNSKNKQDI